MNVLLRFVIVGLLGSGVYIAMTAAGPQTHETHAIAVSTAILLAAALLPVIDPSRITGCAQRYRKRCFERRIDASREHLHIVVKDVVHDVLPNIFDKEQR